MNETPPPSSDPSPSTTKLPLGLDALSGLLDLSFEKPVGLRLIPLFYLLALGAQLYVTLKTSFAVMDVSVSSGIWLLVTGLVWLLILALGLRIGLEALKKFLSSK
jgi:hypothetical protein